MTASIVPGEFGLPPANEDEPLVHSRGFPEWGPPSLCGAAGPVLTECGVVTCTRCLAIIMTPGGVAARADALIGSIGRPGGRR